MTQGIYWKIDNKQQVDHVFKYIREWALEFDYLVPLVLKPEAYKNPRTLTQNALMHIWFREIAEAMNKAGMKIDGEDYTADDAKLLMKYLFLGTEDIIRGKLVIKDQLRSTRKLDKGDAQHFMDDIVDWCDGKNILLSNPAGNEYAKLREAQNGR